MGTICIYSSTEALDLIGRMRNKELPKMALQLGLQNRILLSCTDQTASPVGDVQRIKVPDTVHGLYDRGEGKRRDFGGRKATIDLKISEPRQSAVHLT